MEYDGTDYAGWQAQKNAPAAQTAVERAMERAVGVKARLIGAGRTDAGVHASGQTANFHMPLRIPPDGLKRALNGALPSDISARSVEIAPDRFHARFDATRRVYEYSVWNRPERSALRARFARHWAKPLSLPAWNAMCHVLVGEHDFSSFQKTGGSARSPVRRVEECVCFSKEGEAGMVKMRIAADGFLRGMVRAIVGTFCWIAPDERACPSESAARLREILAARDRSAAGPSAPAAGLCLVRVDYGTNSAEDSLADV